MGLAVNLKYGSASEPQAECGLMPLAEWIETEFQREDS